MHCILSAAVLVPIVLLLSTVSVKSVPNVDSSQNTPISNSLVIEDATNSNQTDGNRTITFAGIPVTQRPVFGKDCPPGVKCTAKRSGVTSDLGIEMIIFIAIGAVLIILCLVYCIIAVRRACTR